MTTGEVTLPAVLGEFARTMLGDYPIQGILDRMVSRTLDVLAVTAVGVTAVAPTATPFSRPPARRAPRWSSSSTARATVRAGSRTAPVGR